MRILGPDMMTNQGDMMVEKAPNDSHRGARNHQIQKARNFRYNRFTQ